MNKLSRTCELIRWKKTHGAKDSALRPEPETLTALLCKPATGRGRGGEFWRRSRQRLWSGCGCGGAGATIDFIGAIEDLAFEIAFVHQLEGRALAPPVVRDEQAAEVATNPQCHVHLARVATRGGPARTWLPHLLLDPRVPDLAVALTVVIAEPAHALHPGGERQVGLGAQKGLHRNVPVCPRTIVHQVIHLDLQRGDVRIVEVSVLIIRTEEKALRLQPCASHIKAQLLLVCRRIDASGPIIPQVFRLLVTTSAGLVQLHRTIQDMEEYLHVLLRCSLRERSATGQLLGTSHHR